jgi:SNF2 family DNA or RNA helicase
MQPAVRFSLDDVVELPDIVERFVDIPLGVKQRKVYDTLARDFQVQVGNDQINAVNAAAAMSKLLQISGGYVYSTALGTVELDADDRKRMLRDLIQSATGKVLVFAPFRHMVTGLSKYLTGDGEKDPDYVEHAVVHGEVTYSARKDIFTLFQDTPKLKAIIAHPGCMAHGLTLTAADTIIWYCPITSLEIYEQANARIRRIGQKHRQQILHLQGTPVEKRIYSLLRAKAKVQDKLLTLFENATTMAQTGQ